MYIKSFAKNPGQNGITLAFFLSPLRYFSASISKSISSLVSAPFALSEDGLGKNSAGRA